jgi:hypothetical protein
MAERRLRWHQRYPRLETKDATEDITLESDRDVLVQAVGEISLITTFGSGSDITFNAAGRVFTAASENIESYSGTSIYLESGTFVSIYTDTYFRLFSDEYVLLRADAQEAILAATSSSVPSTGNQDVILAADADIRKIATGDVLSLSSSGGVCLSTDDTVASPYSGWNPVSPGTVEIQAWSTSPVNNLISLSSKLVGSAVSAEIQLDADGDITVESDGVLSLDTTGGAGDVTISSGGEITCQALLSTFNVIGGSGVQIASKTGIGFPGAGMGNYLHLYSDDKTGISSEDDVNILTTVATAGIRLSTQATETYNNPTNITAGNIEILSSESIDITAADDVTITGTAGDGGMNFSSGTLILQGNYSVLSALGASGLSLGASTGPVSMSAGTNITLAADDDLRLRADTGHAYLSTSHSPTPSNGHIIVAADIDCRLFSDRHVVIQGNSPVYSGAVGTGGILLDLEGELVDSEAGVPGSDYENRVTCCAPEGFHSRVGQDDIYNDPKLIKLAIAPMSGIGHGTVTLDSTLSYGRLVLEPSAVVVFPLHRLPYDVELVMLYVQLDGESTGVTFELSLVRKDVDAGGDPPSQNIIYNGTSSVDKTATYFVIYGTGTGTTGLQNAGTSPPSDATVGNPSNWFDSVNNTSRESGSGDTKWEEHDFFFMVENTDALNALYINDIVVVYKAKASYP